MAYLVLDNGADSMKIGYSTDDGCHIYPNCVSKSKTDRRRILISNQYEELKDFSGLFYMRPFKRGYPSDFDLQSKIWDYAFGKLKVEYDETTLVFTDPMLGMPGAFSGLNEVFFEEYEFSAVCRCNPTWLSNYLYMDTHKEEKCCLVIDSGFSSTTIVPYMKGEPVTSCMKRLNVGGKLLTNYLKDAISYRQMNVMNETYVINQVKEDVCFVSLDLNKDMENAQKKVFEEGTISCEYVLPDFANIQRGYMKGVDKERKAKQSDVEEQTLRLSNERFRVPEILFRPSDVFIKRQGVPELVASIISEFPLAVQPHLYRNILLTGGSTLFPGLRERVERECRALAPQLMAVRVERPHDPVTHAWAGGKLLAARDDLIRDMVVTRDEYAEYGSRLCVERFNTVLHPPPL